MRIALGISHRSQWEERISARSLREIWGDEETVSSKVMRRRLEWLGHLARMPDERMPKTALFSWLPKTRPHCGPKRRWRDVVKKDLTVLEVGAGSWFEACVMSVLLYDSECWTPLKRHLEEAQLLSSPLCADSTGNLS